MQLCKEHRIAVATFVHLVDEIRDICYNVLLNENAYSRGTVNEAIRRYPDVRAVVANLHKAPDALIKILAYRLFPILSFMTLA
jgi:hypothetical protein